jgi:hypothetical protein
MKRWHIEPDGTGYFGVTAPDGDVGPEKDVWAWETSADEQDLIVWSLRFALANWCSRDEERAPIEAMLRNLGVDPNEQV